MNEIKKECLTKEQNLKIAEFDCFLIAIEGMIHNCSKSMDYNMAVIDKLRFIANKIKSMELEIMGIKKIEIEKEKEENT